MRYLLVEIVDDAKADVLAVKLDSAQGARVIGQFKVPTKFCECDMVGMSDHIKHFLPLGAKNGWRICSSCRRPRKGWHQTLTPMQQRDLPPQGRNLYLSFRPPFVDPHVNWTPEQLERNRTKVAEMKVRIDRRARKAERKRERLELETPEWTI